MFFRAFALDLTKEDFLSKLDRVLSREPEKESKTREISMAENIPKLKLILKKWADLPHEPVICETYLELFPNRIAKSKEGRGALIQQDLKFSIDSIALVEDERERIYGDLLRSIYIQRISPHERIAERLNLSMATYYRYLNKGLEKLMKILGNG